MAVAEQERETVRAQARYVRCSARKARLVLDHIRGKPAVEARSILAFQPRAAARGWKARIERASTAGFPRMCSRTSRALRAEQRT